MLFDIWAYMSDLHYIRLLKCRLHAHLFYKMKFLFIYNFCPPPTSFIRLRMTSKKEWSDVDIFSLMWQHLCILAYFYRFNGCFYFFLNFIASWIQSYVRINSIIVIELTKLAGETVVRLNLTKLTGLNPTFSSVKLK